MRPLQLELEGFGTFRDRTTVDFADLDLVAFVGPTGSGKSTVIDAITFALFGSVARYDNPSLVAPIIHQLSAEAKVRFDFEVGGARYTAVRVVRRVKSKPGAGPRATTREARLERFDTPDTSVVLAGNVSELDDEVKRLIGLDFNQFTRTIVLPQGEFAEFLKDDPGNRQKLLRRLLDIDIYARMGSRAREAASEAGHQLDVYRSEVETLSGATAEGLASVRALVGALDEFANTVSSKVGELGEIEDELADRRDDVNRLDAELGRLAEISVPEGLDDIDAKIGSARAILAQAEEALGAGRTERDEAADELRTVGDPNEIAKQLDAHRRLSEAATARSAIEAELAEATTATGQADDALAERQLELDAANDVVRVARTGADAAGWVRQLRPGEPCPVCSQTVAEVPAHVGHDEVEAAEALATAAQRAQATATTVAAKAQGRRQSLEADLAQQHKLHDKLADALQHVDGPDELEARLQAAKGANQRSAEASTAVREAERAVAEAKAAFDSAEAAEGVFRVEFTSQRDAVAQQGPPAPSVEATLVENWRTLADWADDRRASLVAEREQIATVGKELAGRKASAMEALANGAAPFDIAPDPQGLVAEVAAAKARAEAEVGRIGEALARKADLEAKVAELDERRVVHESLGRQHLSANGFERWLLTEALDDIVARATRRLFELSDGRYSLEAIEGSFNVCDHGNADERRDVRTLSGGEIFLASLSLALALAESIAELAPVDSPRLESIFLDEGFGTLDGETLDILASAIEELSATGRLVAIVTHVRDLAERMPVRFEVRKGSVTSTIERSET